MSDMKLKPCPFCGSEDIEVVDNSTEEESDWILQCNGCNTAVIASDEDFNGVELAELIRRWNRRAK